RNCLGMIWSVSTLTRGSAATIPVCVVKGVMRLAHQDGFAGRLELADIGEATGHGRGGGHRRAQQVGAPTLPLPALEVAVGGGGAALPARENVGVHAQAHR